MLNGLFLLRGAELKRGKVCNTSPELLLMPHIHHSQKRLSLQIPVSADTSLGSQNGSFDWMHTKQALGRCFRAQTLCAQLTQWNKPNSKCFGKATLSRALGPTQGLQQLLPHSDIGPGLPKPDTQHFFKPKVLDVLLSGQKIRLLPPDSFSTRTLTLLPRQKFNPKLSHEESPVPFVWSLLENNPADSTL